MKFIADAMLGRLARWLRILGFDTLYIADISDAELLYRARSEGRVVLTRDSGVAGRRAAYCLLIKSDDVQEQLTQIITALKPGFPAKARCTTCNGVLVPVEDKKELAGEVPSHIYLTHNHFFRCRECGNIYWEGSHTKNMKHTLKNIISTESEG